MIAISFLSWLWQPLQRLRITSITISSWPTCRRPLTATVRECCCVVVSLSRHRLHHSCPYLVGRRASSKVRHPISTSTMLTQCLVSVSHLYDEFLFCCWSIDSPPVPILLMSMFCFRAEQRRCCRRSWRTRTCVDDDIGKRRCGTWFQPRRRQRLALGRPTFDHQKDIHG